MKRSKRTTFTAGVTNMWQTIKNWWASWTLSAEERYLANAVDHMDLERRLRNLEHTSYGRDHWWIYFSR